MSIKKHLLNLWISRGHNRTRMLFFYRAITVFLHYTGFVVHLWFSVGVVTTWSSISQRGTHMHSAHLLAFTNKQVTVLTSGIVSHPSRPIDMLPHPSLTRQTLVAVAATPHYPSNMVCYMKSKSPTWMVQRSPSQNFSFWGWLDN